MDDKEFIELLEQADPEHACFSTGAATSDSNLSIESLKQVKRELAAIGPIYTELMVTPKLHAAIMQQAQPCHHNDILGIGGPFMGIPLTFATTDEICERWHKAVDNKQPHTAYFDGVNLVGLLLGHA